MVQRQVDVLGRPRGMHPQLHGVAALQKPWICRLRSLRKHPCQEAVERHLPAQALQVRALLARASLQPSFERGTKGASGLVGFRLCLSRGLPGQLAKRTLQFIVRHAIDFFPSDEATA